MIRWWHTMLRLVRSTVLRTTWIVPRNIICVVFWFGVIIVFIGMILLVTSKHKGSAFLYGGVILLVMGLCIILACFALCMHAYFVLATTVDQEDFKSRCEFKKPLQTIAINPTNVELQKSSQKSKPSLVLPPKFQQTLTKPSFESEEIACFTSNHNNPKCPPTLSSQRTIYENETYLHSMLSESGDSVGKIMEDLKKSTKRQNCNKIGDKKTHNETKKNKNEDKTKSFNEKMKLKKRLKVEQRASSFEEVDIINDTSIKMNEINNSKGTVYENVYHI